MSIEALGAAEVEGLAKENERVWRLLRSAIISRQAEEVERLWFTLEEGEVLHVDGMGRTPLIILLQQRASRRSFRDMVETLTMRSWQLQDSFGKTCLHYYAAKCKGVNAARVVCQELARELEGYEGIPVLVADKRGDTALHCVARNNVATFNRSSPLEESAATVLTRFLVENFPGALQCVNKKGRSPLALLAARRHRGPLEAAIRSATAEDLLFKDGSGATFLVAAIKSRSVLERAVVSIPLDVLSHFDREEILKREREWCPLLASVVSSDHCIRLLECLDDTLSSIIDSELIKTLCMRAAGEGKFRIVLYLMDKGFTDWSWSPDRYGYRPKAIFTTLLDYHWRCHDDVDAAEEVLSRIPPDRVDGILRQAHHVNCFEVLMRNSRMPERLVQLVLSKMPEWAFRGRHLRRHMSLLTRNRVPVVLHSLPESCFSDPALLLAFLDNFYTSDENLKDVLQLCTDDALVAVDGQDSALGCAVMRYSPEEFVSILLARAPAQRHHKNANGKTAMEITRQRHGHYPRGIEVCERLEAMIAGHTLVKSAAL